MAKQFHLINFFFWNQPSANTPRAVRSSHFPTIAVSFPSDASPSPLGQWLSESQSPLGLPLPSTLQRHRSLLMEKNENTILSRLRGRVCSFLRSCLFRVLSHGPIPQHIAFIMDGNRRYASGHNLEEGAGHKMGYLALVSILQYCYELGVKYVTVYAFSIDNFKRKPEEVQTLMDLMREKIGEMMKEESMVNKYGIKINFFGNLNLLDGPVRRAAMAAMEATAGNTQAVLSLCVAYTSTDEILRSVQKSCEEKWVDAEKANLISNGSRYDHYEIEHSFARSSCECTISQADLERYLYTSGCPNPDILVRTSGETRLSNFLLWQTTFCYLLATDVLWPEISLWHLVWAILEFQRVLPYLEKKKKKNL